MSIELMLPLTYAAQQQLERTKAEIVSVHGSEHYPAKLGILRDSQALTLQHGASPAIDGTIATTLLKSENLCSVAVAVKGLQFVETLGGWVS
ncbi:hypothetical protein TWF506_011246 [Arthrobotrys conoides]|uniref:Uncharacterized protein n=1 Tax=Arthrobotrys conoides TaxID=74498 RepID=A0AAN8RKF6_9PEZI